MKFLIDFVNTATDIEIQAYFSANGATPLKEFSSFEKCYLIEVATEPPITEIVEHLHLDAPSSLNLHQYPIPPGETFPELQVETAAESQWWKICSFNRPDLNLTFQDYERRGSTSTVYLVDSGVQIALTEFQYADITNLFSFNNDFQDYVGHGTSLAALIVGNNYGITNAKLKVLKISQPGVNTLVSDIVAAFDAIISDISTNSPTFPIVNLSWGVPANTYIEDKIRSLVNAGVVVVCSAGNSGAPIDNTLTPARMPEVITVGSYNANLEPSAFSNYAGSAPGSPPLDIWAPGENITSTSVTNGSVTILNGTSAASAIMSAILAYNSTSMVLSDGSVPSAVLELNFAFQYTAARPGLLTLTGVYTSSSTKVATIIAEYDGQNGSTYALVSAFNILIESNTLAEKMIYNFLTMTSFNIQNPLPSGFQMNNGWLVGSKTVTEPFYWESVVTYTKHDSTVINTMMRIAVLPTNITINSPGVDQVIPIYYFDPCAPVQNIISGLWSCSGTCGVQPGPCYSACPEPTKDPGSLLCTCTPFVVCP